MKQLILFLSALLMGQFIQAQSVGIGTASPNSRAQLDVVSTTKGLLIPRMTSADRLAIPSPVPPGLMVYETTSNSFWYYNGTSWVQHVPGTSPWTVSSANIYNSNTGNVGIGTSANINEKLTVKGDVLFAHPSGSNSVTLSLMANTNNQARINFIRPDSSVLGSIYSWDLNDNLHFQQSSNTNQLVLNDNGFVGIRTNLPTEALDVFGSIRSRDTITADDDLVAGDDVRAGDDVIAGGIVSGSSLQTSGNLAVAGIGIVSGNFTANGTLNTNSNLTVGGTSTLTGDVTTTGDIVVNNATGTLQLRNGSNVNKGFVQLSADNLRLGTNSGNTQSVIFRLNGNDRTTMYANGDINIEGKITKQAETGFSNLLPAAYGRVDIDGNKTGGTSNFSVVKSATGFYILYIPQFISTSTIVITTEFNNIPRLAHYSFPATPGIVYVEIYNPAAFNRLDSGFSFIVYQ